MVVYLLNRGSAKALVRMIPAIDRLVRQRDQLRQELDSLRAKNSLLEHGENLSSPAFDRKFERLWRQIEFIKGRLSSYIGDGVALTYLEDETPFFINSNDFGGPANFLNGGIYEPDNLDVIQSFLRPDTKFLDVGANLGFFSVMVAQRLGVAGSVTAFEPHPLLCDLMRRSVFLNGLTERVSVRNHGVSDRDGEAEFAYPQGHLGGGAISPARGREIVVRSHIKRLDDIVAPDTTVDIIKIDVEGHELHVIRGMLDLIARCRRLVILLEKLERKAGIEQELSGLLRDRGYETYAVGPGARLSRLSGHSLIDWSGYILATRPQSLECRLWRNFFAIYPMHLQCSNTRSGRHPDGTLTVAANQDQPLFWGPYWFLRRGTWKITLHGKADGRIKITIAERFGHPVVDVVLEDRTLTAEFATDHDLVKFECIAHPLEGAVEIELNRIELERLG